MKYKIIRKQRLTEIIPVNRIVSIIEIRGYYGCSLAIGIKDDNPTLCHRYGGNSNDTSIVNTVFFSLDRYSYHAPSYVAIPKEQYKNIVVIKKRALFDSEQERNESDIAGEFIKATIVKKVVW